MNGAVQFPNGTWSAVNGARVNGSDLTQVARAREQFAAGADSVSDVRPEVLMSWYRCREQYRVDPWLEQAPAATQTCHHSMIHDVVFAELGGHAAKTAKQVDGLNGLVAVADDEGRMLSSWGNRRICRIAAESNLAPWASWSESASGTNGIGSALQSHEPVLVRGPEHWCQGFHAWQCAGVAVRDLVTDQPLAVLDISCWRSSLPDSVLTWLAKISAAVEAKLQQREHHNGTLLAGALAESHACAGTPLAVVDLAGKVIQANDDGAALLGITPPVDPAYAPAQRWAPQLPALPQLTRRAIDRAKADPCWTGQTHVFVPFLDTGVSISMQPVFSGCQVIGLLLALGSDDAAPALATSGDEFIPAEIERPNLAFPRHVLSRVIACRDHRWVLLDPREIRFAEVDHNHVWLITDHGRLLAASRGLDRLAEQLTDWGFLRVHRQYLVNLGRIREVEMGFKQTLVLTTDARRHETVPVARRHTAQVRQLLGL